ncbi:MAG: polyprenyl synthetase family protein [Lachnospiraceae bacterium]|nr:polyprenyl synthetase family protein [Lachnospiraceae bacterium]
MNDLRTALETKAAEAERVVKDRFVKGSEYNSVLISAMDYSLSAGGKRIRPVILLETCRVCGGKDPEGAEGFAAALEMIHTYSLIHDDLPAMDDDDMRRGRPSNHKVYGEAMAILAGDGLLNMAFEVCADTLKMAGDPETLKRRAAAFALLADKAGVNGMIGGQSVDVDLNGQLSDDDTLSYVYRNKTSALLQAAFAAGAICGGADDSDIAKWEEIGYRVGMAFQVRDDILDETGTEEELGKPVHSDDDNDKYTYVRIHGLEAGERYVAEMSDAALDLLDGIDAPGDKTFLRELIMYMIRRNN